LEFYTSAFCPILANTLSGAINHKHVLTTGALTDPYCGFPIVALGVGSFLLKLGNDLDGK